jgi:hypothetical protein
LPKERIDIREKLKAAKKSIADLCRETKIDYRRLSGIINGYWVGKPEQEKRIQDAIKSFESKQ